MSESGQPGKTAASPMDRGIDPDGMIHSLRAQGANGFDPVRFRFIEALARRAAAHQGNARSIIDGKLGEALTEYRERFAQAQDGANGIVARTAEQFPEAADDLRQLCSAGDFRGLHCLVARLQSNGYRSPLADLVASVTPRSPEDGDGGSADDVGPNAGAHAELKSLRYFRSSWSKLRVDQQLSQALAQAPKNAGPLNSHLLVLQSIKLMREISPEYLNRFVSYADTLLWLDQADSGRGPPQKEAVRGDSDKKRKTGRARSG
jgi:hypothetical protein